MDDAAPWGRLEHGASLLLTVLALAAAPPELSAVEALRVLVVVPDEADARERLELDTIASRGWRW